MRIVAFCVAILFLTLVYNLCAYRNFATPEAMDSAQLARNMAEGKGYTTLFIRPFSLYLVQRHNQAGRRMRWRVPGRILRKSKLRTRTLPIRPSIRSCWPV